MLHAFHPRTWLACLASIVAVGAAPGAVAGAAARSAARQDSAGRAGLAATRLSRSSSRLRPQTTESPVVFNGTTASNWMLNQSAASSRIVAVPDPTGAPGDALQFTTLNSDIAPLTPTSNPRSQLDSPYVLVPGQQYWESFEVYLPNSFPTVPGGWVSLQTVAYGAPWNGSPPAGISLVNGQFRYQRDGYAPVPWQIAWSSPAAKGQWTRFTWHFLFASKGWIELYIDGEQVTLLSGSQQVLRMPVSLIDPTDDSGPWFTDLQLYYQYNMFPSATVLFKNFRVATTLLAATTGE